MVQIIALTLVLYALIAVAYASNHYNEYVAFHEDYVFAKTLSLPVGELKKVLERDPEEEKKLAKKKIISSIYWPVESVSSLFRK